MSKRAVLLPNGHWCGLGVYVASWRALKGLSGDASIRGWDHFPAKAEDVLRDLRGGMHDRINKHLAGYGAGRKFQTSWQVDCRRDARIINDYAARRVVHPVNRLSTPELQRRFQWSYSSTDGVSVRLGGRA